MVSGITDTRDVVMTCLLILRQCAALAGLVAALVQIRGAIHRLPR